MSSESSLRFFISWSDCSLARARRSSWNRGSRSISTKTLSDSSRLSRRQLRLAWRAAARQAAPAPGPGRGRERRDGSALLLSLQGGQPLLRPLEDQVEHRLHLRGHLSFRLLHLRDARAQLGLIGLGLDALDLL